MRLHARLLIVLAFVLAASVLAQDVQYAVGFESVDGEPVASDGFACGDVVVLRVDLRNGSDATVQPGAFWVAPFKTATPMLQVTVSRPATRWPTL